MTVYRHHAAAWNKDFRALSQPPEAASTLYGHLEAGAALGAALELGNVLSSARMRLMLLVSIYPGITGRDACRLTRRTHGTVMRDLDILRRHGLVRGVTQLHAKRSTRILWSLSSTGGALLDLAFGTATRKAIEEETLRHLEWLVGGDPSDNLKSTETQSPLGADPPAQE